MDLRNICSHIPGWSLWGSVDRCHLCRPECYCWWRSSAGPWSSLWTRKPELLQSVPGRRWYPGTRRTATQKYHQCSEHTQRLLQQMISSGRIVFIGMLEGQTYKFEQERVFSQRSNATSEPQDEHHTTHHQEEPDWVKTPQVCDGWDVRKDTLKEKESQKCWYTLICCFYKGNIWQVSTPLLKINFMNLMGHTFTPHFNFR